MPTPPTATYTPSNNGPTFVFGMLVQRPTRETIQQVSERLITGSNDAVIDIIGKPVTKIRGLARVDGYQSLKTFEGAVGTDGNLVYSEEPTGVQVIFVGLTREQVVGVAPNDKHLCGIEFWVLPPGTLT